MDISAVLFQYWWAFAIFVLVIIAGIAALLFKH